MSTTYPIVVASSILMIFLATILAAPGCKKTENAPDNLELTELKLDLDAVTAATPGFASDAVKPPHLRQEKKRPPLMVVPNLKNLALYKPVSADKTPTMGELEQITDGIKTSEDFDIVEGPAWVQVDLTEQASIHAIVIWHFYKNPVIYNDMIVCVSSDVNFSANVTTLFNNDHDNSAAMGKGNDTAHISRWWGEIVDARNNDHTPTKARYVRLYTGKTTEGRPPRYIEIEVYGKPNPDDREK